MWSIFVLPFFFKLMYIQDVNSSKERAVVPQPTLTLMIYNHVENIQNLYFLRLNIHHLTCRSFNSIHDHQNPTFSLALSYERATYTWSTAEQGASSSSLNIHWYSQTSKGCQLQQTYLFVYLSGFPVYPSWCLTFGALPSKGHFTSVGQRYQVFAMFH